MANSAEVIERKYRRSRVWNIVLGAAVLFLTVIVAAQLFPGQSPTSAAPVAPPAPEESPSAEESAGVESSYAKELPFVRRDADDPMAIGDVDAPVVLSEWIDMRCPFCAVYSRETLPILIEEYVDTGKVRIEFHDLVFYGEHSEAAAIAARAAGEQGKYVEYVTAVYEVAPEGSHPDMPREKLIGFAEEVGVPDMEQFVADLDDPELRDAVKQSGDSAQQIGVSATPFFVAGNSALSGAQPVDVFRDFLDAALDEAE